MTSRTTRSKWETDTLERAAAELDLAAAAAEVYRSTPDLVSPETMRDDLVAAMPELLGKS